MACLLKLREVAALTGVPINTLRFYRSQGGGPRSFLLAGRVVYKASDVEAWIEASYEADHRDPQPAA